jgi:hypothetical protein
MKCAACKYEKDWNLDDNGDVVDVGNEEFAKINGVTTLTGDYYKTETVVSLYVCPKCGTVRYE